MNRNPLIRLCFSLFIGIAASLSAVAQAAAMTAAEQVQVYASRATSSLLLVRGEGFQEEHLTRLEKDIADLETSAQAAMSASSEIPGLTTKLVTQLRLGVSFGPNEDNMPWEYPQDLAKALRELLTVARGVPDADPLGELPLRTANVVAGPQHDAEREVHQRRGKRDGTRRRRSGKETGQGRHQRNRQHYREDGKSGHISSPSPR